MNNNKSNYTSDINNEQILTKWIIDNYISKYSNDYKIITDSKIQNKGVDIILMDENIFGSNSPYNIDLKAALDYVRPLKDEHNKKPNKMPTFAFELSFFNEDEQEREGWLFGKKYNETEYYMLCWIWADLQFEYNEAGYIETNMDYFSYNSIEEVEIIVIQKETIQNYAKKYNIDSVSSITQSKKMRNNRQKRLSLAKHKKYPQLNYSMDKKEKPVNLVVSFHELKKMAIFQKIITVAPSKQEKSKIIKSTSPTIQKTCNLFNQGFSVKEIIIHRDLAKSTVINHLYCGAKDGILNSVDSGLAINTKQNIYKAIQVRGVEKLAPIKAELDERLGNDTISYYEIKRYLIEKYSNM